MAKVVEVHDAVAAALDQQYLGRVAGQRPGFQRWIEHFLRRHPQQQEAECALGLCAWNWRQHIQCLFSIRQGVQVAEARGAALGDRFAETGDVLWERHARTGCCDQVAGTVEQRCITVIVVGNEQ